MKEFFRFALVVVVLSLSVQRGAAMDLSADCAILIEYESGRVLYEKNADTQSLIASITKLMTALVAVDSGFPLEQTITITAQSCNIEGSSIYLKPNEEISLKGLLYGLLLHSGNDAATAIAIHCAENQVDFVALMNQKANELGMTNTHFENPHGLDADTHYSTAQDMAILARACLENDFLREVVATKQISIAGRVFINHNKLLWQYEDAIGLKTGYTMAAGRTLISAVERDGKTLIAVTLNAPDDWNDHKKLFDYGLETYQMTTLARAGERLLSLPLTASILPTITLQANTTMRYPLKEGEQITLEFITVPLQAPVSMGELSGVVAVWTLSGVGEVATLPLVFAETRTDNLVPKMSLWQRIKTG